MHTSRKQFLLLLLLATCFVWSCKTVQSLASAKGNNNIEGESFVLANTTSSNFLYASIVKGSVSVRSTYLPSDSGSITYQEGTDFTINYKKGTIARTLKSRIPNYANHPLFEKINFDQNEFSNYSNNPYFIWVDYTCKRAGQLVETTNQSNFLAGFKNKLLLGSPINIVSSGNSIAAGGEASSEALRYQNRWVDYLKKQYPTSTIQLEDASLPGYTTTEAIFKWDATVGQKNPDLILLGWGMNEANIGGMTPSEYKNNLITLAEKSKQFKNAEVVIYSCFRPNENWRYASHKMELYTQAAKEAAASANCAYVDVYGVYEKVFARKDQSSLLSNNINHPNNFGHWLYLRAFMNVVF
jgi:acyl-CoA thioesterase-1